MTIVDETEGVITLKRKFFENTEDLSKKFKEDLDYSEVTQTYETLSDLCTASYDTPPDDILHGQRSHSRLNFGKNISNDPEGNSDISKTVEKPIATIFSVPAVPFVMNTNSIVLDCAYYMDAHPSLEYSNSRDSRYATYKKYEEHVVTVATIKPKENHQIRDQRDLDEYGHIYPANSRTTLKYLSILEITRHLEEVVNG